MREKVPHETDIPNRNSQKKVHREFSFLEKQEAAST